MILGYSILQIMWYFLIYSFLGWCLEVVYCTVTSGSVCNRGFMNGPVCPVYGFGMLAILGLLRFMGNTNVTQANSWVLFIGGLILASLVELMAGWVLMKLFHTRWWDYSMRPFNLGGYICLQFSIAWGLGTVFAIKVLHSTLMGFVENGFLMSKYSLPLLLICLAVFTVDLIVTLSCVIGLNKRLTELDDVSQKISTISENLSERLGTRALEADRKVTEGKVQLSLAKAEAREISERIVGEKTVQYLETRADMLERREKKLEESQAILEQKRLLLEQRAMEIRSKIYSNKFSGPKRIIKAFPTIHHEIYTDLLEDIKKNVSAK